MKEFQVLKQNRENATTWQSILLISFLISCFLSLWTQESYFGHYAGRLWLFVCLWAAAKISLVCLFWFRTLLSPGTLWHRLTSLPTKSGSTIHSNQSQTRHSRPIHSWGFWVGLAGSWVYRNYKLRARRLPLFVANVLNIMQHKGLCDCFIKNEWLQGIQQWAKRTQEKTSVFNTP